MKIEFEVPDGNYCLDCPHQEGFGVSEICITSCGDPHQRYMREIVANCHLFNERTRGVQLSQMNKCNSCLNIKK